VLPLPTIVDREHYVGGPGVGCPFIQPSIQSDMSIPSGGMSTKLGTTIHYVSQGQR